MNLISNADLKFLKRFINLDTSVKHKENLYKAIKLLREHFHSYGLSVKTEQIYVNEDFPSLVLANNIDLKQDIILLGHIDIVENDLKEIKAFTNDDYLYGLGAGDMKAAILALLKIFIQILKDNLDIKVALILTSDEELGGINGSSYLFNTVNYSSDIAFVPNNGKNLRTICIAEKGVLHYHCVSKGKSAHGARPWKGENAIDNLLSFYQQLKRFYDNPKNDTQWKKSLNLGKIFGGTAINTVADKAEMFLDIRFTEKDNKEDLMDQIESLAKEYNVNAFIRILSDPVSIDKDNLYLLRLSKIIEDYYKKPVEFMRSNLASDARYLAENGITVLSMRPDSKHIHKADESVKISAIEDYADIVYKFIKEETLLRKKN